MNFECSKCGATHDLSGTIEEAELNGYHVENIMEECPDCAELVRFERSVEEL